MLGTGTRCLSPWVLQAPGCSLLSFPGGCPKFPAQVTRLLCAFSKPTDSGQGFPNCSPGLKAQTQQNSLSLFLCCC